MALGRLAQESFAAGMWRSTRAPQDSFYDGINALVGDDGLLFKRGGTAYLSQAAPTSVGYVYPMDLVLAGGRRTIASNGFIDTITSDGGAITEEVCQATLLPQRPIVVAGIALFADAAARGVRMWAGSLRAAGSSYTTGTVTVTNGSPVVTGAGTNWTGASLDAGSIFSITTPTNAYGIVSVDSATQVTLNRPYQGATAAGINYTIYSSAGFSYSAFQPQKTPVLVAAADRLLYCVDQIIWFSPPNNPSLLTANDYHELASGSIILGGIGAGGTAYLFATDGVWTVSDLRLDALDDYGNLQHRVNRINNDLILWGNSSGIVGWRDGYIVPAVDDVYVLTPDGLAQPISEPIRPLYRSYVEAGHKPGLAAIYRGHLFLPIVDGADPSNNPIREMLVCRLDRDQAWTRWTGHGASRGFAVRTGTTPKLIGVSSNRLLDVTGCFTPAGGNKNDADGTTPNLTVITRDYPIGPNDMTGQVRRLRVTYELADAASDNPTLTGYWARDAEGASFTALSGSAAEDPTGQAPKTWPVEKAARRIRYKVVSSGASANMKLRRIESFIRPRQRP